MQIFPTHLEWSHILFRLQLTLADPSVQLIRVIKYASQFQPKHLNEMKIDCAINVTDLDQVDLQNIIYGNPARQIFQAGHIKLNLQSSQNKTNKILFFKIAVDQAMPIHKSGSAQLNNITQFPIGIDTIYVSQNKQQLNIYPHKYKVKDKSQCCLQYEVDFIRKGINNIPKWSPKDLLCQYCEISKAIHYCPQDKQLYCGKCFQQLHRSTKKRGHSQKQLSPFNSAPYCSFHPKQRYILYCLDCMQLKCEKCVQNQIHKTQKKHTQIMPLPELEKTLKQKEIAFLKQTKERTKNLIMKSQLTLDKLQKNYQLQKHDLEQKFAAKLLKIRQQSNKKIMRAISLHTELKRKYDELLWVENYIHFCEQFLLAQDNIQMKDSFFVYLQKITTKDYYLLLDKNLQEII